MRRAWIVALLAGCSFHPGAAPGPMPGDGGPDAPIHASDGPVDSPGMTVDGDPQCGWGFTPTNFDPCMLAGSPVPLDLTSTGLTIDPDATTLPHTRVTQPADGSTIVVIHLASLTVDGASSLSIQAAPDVAGVVLAVDGDATIAGRVQVAGTDNPSGCGSAAGTMGANSMNSNDGAGGGGGGAASADGGDGGDGNGPMKGAKGPKGSHVSNGAMLSPLRGGCPGGAGGLISGSIQAAAPGGAGGGALEISARGMISTMGLIEAAGQGGKGAPGRGDGGGGGGAGGGILLEAPAVTNSGVLCADGGSGGEGGGASSMGFDGNAGACNGFGPARTPKVNGTLGGDGGDGGYKGSVGGGDGGGGLHQMGYPNGGGGGGGGGVGWIRLRAAGGTPTVSGTVTPAPQLQ